MPDPTPCTRCGTPHPRCKGHNRAGQPCGLHPIPGGRVCRWHGGASPQAQAAAARRTRDAEAARAATRLGLPRDVDPATALLEEVQRAAGAVAYIEQQIAAIDPDLIVRGIRMVRRIDTGETDPTTITESGPGLNEWVKLWHTERTLLVKAATAALAAGVAERQVQLAERQGALVAEVIRGVLDDLDLTPEQTARAMAVVPARLRLISS